MVSCQREHQLGCFVAIVKTRTVLKEILAKKPIRQRTMPGYGWAFVATCAGVPRTLFWSPLMVVRLVVDCIGYHKFPIRSLKTATVP
jgi:hypothetical protein